MSSAVNKLSRRDFLKAGLAVSSGLTLGLRLGSVPADEAAPFMPNAFVRIGADNSVTIIAKHVETLPEYRWLCDEGIRLFQGDLFASPGFEQLPSATYPAIG